MNTLAAIQALETARTNLEMLHVSHQCLTCATALAKAKEQINRAMRLLENGNNV